MRSYFAIVIILGPRCLLLAFFFFFKWFRIILSTLGFWLSLTSCFTSQEWPGFTFDHISYSSSQFLQSTLRLVYLPYIRASLFLRAAQVCMRVVVATHQFAIFNASFVFMLNIQIELFCENLNVKAGQFRTPVRSHSLELVASTMTHFLLHGVDDSVVENELNSPPSELLSTV